MVPSRQGATGAKFTHGRGNLRSLTIMHAIQASSRSPW
jgi:hypothetical protein